MSSRASKAMLIKAALLGLAGAQMKGDVGPPDEHPKINMEECDEDGTCKSKEYSLVLDMSWRWLHNVGGYTNCLGEDGVWAEKYCPDGATCAKKCAVEGLNSTQYSDTYGIKAEKDASGVTLKYVPGSRIYLLDGTGKEYLMFKLKNKEFTFDVDLSTLPCGTNAALYLIEMAADGGGSDAGAAYGAGYCDAQCPRGAKFINNKANTEDWGMTLAETPEYKWMEVGPEGKYGACCAEFDILEANNQALAITSHPCSIEGLEKCSNEEECGNKSAGYPGWCDKDGCGLNSYRLGEPEFYGLGSTFTLDTSKPFTVITQFITDDGTDDGDLVEIKRKYIQGGKVIDNAMASVLDEDDQSNTLNDDLCDAIVKKFNVTKKEKHHKARKSRTWYDSYKLNGGSKAMGDAIGRGMVMSMSVWDDGLGRMNWLDSEKTLIDEDMDDPGVMRGPCKFEDGDPKKLRKENTKAYVKFSNLKMGPIGSTFSDDGSSALAAPEPAPPQDEDEDMEDPAKPLATGDEDDDIGDLTVSDEDEADDDEETEELEETEEEVEEEEEEAEEEVAPVPAPAVESFTPTDGCEWIPDDNCEDTNDFACGCREANPLGPCTPCDGAAGSKPKKALAAKFALGPLRLPAASRAPLLAVAGVAAAALAAAVAALRRRRSADAAGLQLLDGDEEASFCE